MDVDTLTKNLNHFDALIKKLYNEKYYVILGMQTYGGSFMRALGSALAHADGTNTFLIYFFWDDEWEKYKALGKDIEAKEEK